jgi:hypothetical protein
MTFMEWLTLFSYVFFSEAFVFLNILYLASFILAVFFYRTVRFLTNLKQTKRFLPWHYFVFALIGTVFLAWLLFIPFEAQVEMTRNKLPVGEHETYSRLFMSKPLLRAAFMLAYCGFITRLFIRYYRRTSNTESFVCKPVRCITFLIILSLAFMLPSILTILLPRNEICSSAWTAITAFGMSGQYIALTFHIIRRKYLPYVVYEAPEEKCEKSEEGRRLHAGKLTRRRLNVWFRKQKPYLNGDFKITDAAKAMDVNRSVISAFINSNYGMNFNRFVNRWRLEELDRLRTLPSNKGKSITQLFSKAGFTEARQYYRAVAAEREKPSES